MLKMAPNPLGSCARILGVTAAILDRSDASFAMRTLSNRRATSKFRARPRTKTSLSNARAVRVETTLSVAISPNSAQINKRGRSSDDPSANETPFTAAVPLRPLVVCGPSGVGKGTIIARFMEDISSPCGDGKSLLPKFGFTVSHTTRSPRPGEVDGVHYNFCTHDFVREKIESGDFFIEHAEVHGNLYGTSFQSIYEVSTCEERNEGGGGVIQCLLDVDVQGVRSIKEFEMRQQSRRRSSSSGAEGEAGAGAGAGTLPDLAARYVFVTPPSLSTLRERLQSRGTETLESLELRFTNAERELEYGLEDGNFDAVVVNDDLDQACDDFGRIVREMYGS